MSGQKTQIVVIGAGYAGLLATLRLAGKTRRQNVALTLVNATLPSSNGCGCISSRSISRSSRAR